VYQCQIIIIMVNGYVSKDFHIEIGGIFRTINQGP
jgi:hypothetical protein